MMFPPKTQKVTFNHSLEGFPEIVVHAAGQKIREVVEPVAIPPEA
jgi:hypothetical protein